MKVTDYLCSNCFWCPTFTISPLLIWCMSAWFPTASTFIYLLLWHLRFALTTLQQGWNAEELTPLRNTSQAMNFWIWVINIWTSSSMAITQRCISTWSHWTQASITHGGNVSDNKSFLIYFPFLSHFLPLLLVFPEIIS